MSLYNDAGAVEPLNSCERHNCTHSAFLHLKMPPGSTSLRVVKEKLGLNSSDSGMSLVCKGTYI